MGSGFESQGAHYCQDLPYSRPYQVGGGFFMVEQRPMLNQALALFVLDCQAQRFTPSTLRLYRGRLSLCAKWCAAHHVVALSDLKASHLRSYLVDMQDRARSSAYVHSQARAIKLFFRISHDVRPALQNWPHEEERNCACG